MDGAAAEYWPFEFPAPEERTDLHRRLRAFLEDADRDGLRPCRFADGEYRVEAGDRSGWLLYRGRPRGGPDARWEVWLTAGDSRVHALRVVGFDEAAAAALGWVRGGTTDGVTAAAAAITHA